jgi:ribosome-associated heat shock protein Hsp15
VSAEDRDWQRLDKWLWCARYAKTRAACARAIEAGAIRVNRQPTAKPDARIRPGDVLTLPWGTTIRVVRVLRLAARRGPPAEAATMFESLP